ncbi:hypothetical protein SAMN05421797_101530 [Maribacter ulvicola]|uniref:Uncharacterized protein n=1 Tax=Maribacter ulvicola TaxID=228959 RepID=A0A1N6PNQ8_9FLAO|nr:hypothetical protein SAMN05421797_101530 [Maribacter ulvicola]
MGLRNHFGQLLSFIKEKLFHWVSIVFFSVSDKRGLYPFKNTMKKKIMEWSLKSLDIIMLFFLFLSR